MALLDSNTEAAVCMDIQQKTPLDYNVGGLVGMITAPVFAITETPRLLLKRTRRIKNCNKEKENWNNNVIASFLPAIVFNFTFLN